MNACGHQPQDTYYGPCTREAGHTGPCAHPPARQQEATESFLRSVQQVLDAEPLCWPFDPLARTIWRQAVEVAATKIQTLMLDGWNDRIRQQVRCQLVQIAAMAWRAARALNVEDEIPF